MEEKVQTESEISLLDIIKLLLGKIKLLILVVLIAAVMGGAFAVWKTYDVNYWGTTVEFYVNPERPKDATGENGGSQYGVYGAYGRHVMDNIVKLLGSESFAEKLMEGLEGVPARTVIDETTGKEVLSSEYVTLLRRVVSAVSFSYLEENADVSDANNLARSFIYVKISVLNDKAFAEELLEQVRREVPIYVEANMAVPTDYTGTNCQQITILDSVGLTNPGYTTRQAIKYALLASVAALLVACVVIILVDRSDKRLRDYETVMRGLGVPVLGVIPTIEAITEEHLNKKASKSASSNRSKKEAK